MGGNLHYIKHVYLMELLSFGKRGAGHSSQLVIHLEVVLDSNSGKGTAFLLDLDMLPGFDCLVQAFGVAAAPHQTPSEFINDYNLTVLYHILLVPLI